MSTQPKTYITVEEYFALERDNAEKHEYFAGEVFAMGGASESHNLIASNCVRELGQQLKQRPCKVYTADMRVKVSPSGLYTYPDVTVVCGEAKFDEQQLDTLLNPTVIIEVLSKSSESYDRGAKFGHYRKLESLSDYVIISQDESLVEHYTRQPDNQWLLSDANEMDQVVSLSSIGCELPLAEIYDKVALGG